MRKQRRRDRMKGDASTEWFEEAKEVFDVPKPERFTNCSCLECREHQERLSATNVDWMTIDDLDVDYSAITMASPEGQKYYLPALMRIAMETVDSGDFLSTLMLILSYKGSENRLLEICDRKQAELVSRFLEHLIEQYPAQLDSMLLTDEVLETHELWSRAGS